MSQLTHASVSRQQKVFYAAVGLLAAWVGAWGLVAPAYVDWALPWIVPPLHARFLGAMYVSGATFMLGAILARHWSAIRVIVPMISIWTGTLLLVSLLYLPAFDFTHHQVWIWFAAYLIYPVIAAIIAWRKRTSADHGTGPAVPQALKQYLLAQGVLVTLLALVLLFLPQVGASLWPWPITPLLTQLYGAPFLAYGLGSLYATRQAAKSDLTLFLLGTAVFTATVLAASIIHLALFSFNAPASWLWFAGFGLATLILVLSAGHSLRT
ncbi:MAG TPA: hypothetical protein VGL99_22900 [Chloroflexota bacterium]|jgi:hypothetical protein